MAENLKAEAAAKEREKIAALAESIRGKIEEGLGALGKKKLELEKKREEYTAHLKAIETELLVIEAQTRKAMQRVFKDLGLAPEPVAPSAVAKPTKAKRGGKRPRMSAEETAALKNRIAEFVKKEKTGAKVKDIAAAVGAKKSQVARLLGALQDEKAVKMEGTKSTARYVPA